MEEEAKKAQIELAQCGAQSADSVLAASRDTEHMHRASVVVTGHRMNPKHTASPPMILGAVCAVLVRGTPPRDAVQELLARDPREEA